jgi:hypothetical protein
MSGAELAERVQARRSGGGWVARCPAHHDRYPSLSIAERDGKILLCCHAGCTAEAICDALGIRVSDLFGEPRTARKPETQIVRDTRKVDGGFAVDSRRASGNVR